MQGGADGLELEAHLAKTHLARDRFQRVLRLAVGAFVSVDEMHRATEHGRVETAPGLCLCAPFEFGDEARQQVAKAQGASADLGLAVDQARAQQALQRPHQAAIVAFQVLGQRITTEVGAALVGIEEHRRRQGRPAVLERNQGWHARTQPADGGVRRAEVDTAGSGELRHVGRTR